MRFCLFLLLVGAITSSLPLPSAAQLLEHRLLNEDPLDLVHAANQQGDARRGAILFYQPYMACTKCHRFDEQESALGPDLTQPDPQANEAYVVDSVLRPSKEIKKAYEAITVITVDGKSLSGLLVEQTPERVVLRDATQDGKLITLADDEIDELAPSALSIMPAGQVNVLASRQQFLDLLRYLLEIRHGGLARARELEPPPQLYAARPLPEYEQQIDHAGMIRSLDQEAFGRGEAIYNRLCINCHGTHDKPGSLPTSLRFASGKFKNGSDPYTMYQTLTRGFGMMMPQTWMVPEQKYDVIHYIREAYLEPRNQSQYARISDPYLAGLPEGSTRGPKPSTILPWEQMDYGHNLIATYEIGSDGTNFAYKGNAIRLDPGPGGVSQGRHWLVFDYDTLRMAAAWSGKGFIDWNGINFNGQHGVHPRVVGTVNVANPTGPGWANPEDRSLSDPRLRGRDNRPYGPLPRNWARYQGMYYHGNRVIVAYTVGNTAVLETPGMQEVAAAPVFKRTFNIGPREKEMLLQVAHHADDDRAVRLVETNVGGRGFVMLGPPDKEPRDGGPEVARVHFDGATHLEVDRPEDFDMTGSDFTIDARIKTRRGGTILAKTSTTPEWVPNGQTFFVRGGRLCFDIGWVGVVQSLRRVNDGRWHHVAMTYQHKTGQVQLMIDGRVEAAKRLKAEAAVDNQVLRIGYTATNFPGPQTYFEGEIADVRFHDRALEPDAISIISGDAPAGSESGSPSQTRKPTDAQQDESLIGHWRFDAVADETVRDASGKSHQARIVVGGGVASTARQGTLVAGFAGDLKSGSWQADDGNLRLQIPAGDQPLRFVLWMANVADQAAARQLAESLNIEDSGLDLQRFTRGGPPRWPDELTTEVVLGRDDGPFAVDVLMHPVSNPWFCRTRLTGFDFYPDGDRAAVCAWDGNVWLVSGLSQLPDETVAGQPHAQLTWRRIASGLFQPLGLKIVDGRIFVSCRDQICILHDLNGDGETDFYENFNNDHQVTDHFHEFAMGLQTDDDGNFYYAKSARHALTALVPHHGTLLRVSRDGERTDILANGFRAANGVCVNPDGTFIVTDQEGHWNPKNRINWVREGGFYGNMFGYHDVTDSSDEAMEQPLCWITNDFDRSPAELLWVDSDKWGPLAGSLLNFSYGYGKIYVVPHEQLDGQMQGGMCELPLPQFPTGTMRGRFHARDGQLYTCGMFAWAGNQQSPGGFFRVRYTGKPVYLPLGLRARRQGMEITFSAALDPQAVSDPANYQVKVWSLKRTENYGSQHYHEHSLRVARARVAEDGTTVMLEIPEIGPTWCMEIKYSLRGSTGQPVRGTIHNTIHALGE